MDSGAAKRYELVIHGRRKCRRPGRAPARLPDYRFVMSASNTARVPIGRIVPCRSPIVSYGETRTRLTGGSSLPPIMLPFQEIS